VEDEVSSKGYLPTSTLDAGAKNGKVQCSCWRKGQPPPERPQSPQVSFPLKLGTGEGEKWRLPLGEKKGRIFLLSFLILPGDKGIMPRGRSITQKMTSTVSKTWNLSPGRKVNSADIEKRACSRREKIFVVKGRRDSCIRKQKGEANFREGGGGGEKRGKK